MSACKYSIGFTTDKIFNFDVLGFLGSMKVSVPLLELKNILVVRNRITESFGLGEMMQTMCVV